ncbi:hypothetical protein COO60DRAFT_1517463 [Scenedesmus sp. NREL 46B-D3]|nr:hypothetical protein COO60DRAFT_1517463 [Scenedesmus sp. NREL 46B-D3]
MAGVTGVRRCWRRCRAAAAAAALAAVCSQAATLLRWTAAVPSRASSPVRNISTPHPWHQQQQQGWQQQHQQQEERLLQRAWAAAKQLQHPAP